MNPLLITVRQLFDDARRKPVCETVVSRVQATLCLDHCAELALNLVIRDFGGADDTQQLGGRSDLPWHKLWDLADKVAREKGLEAGLPNRPALKTLHEARNLTQHRGSIPSIEEARGAIEPVRQLLASIYAGLYDVDFEHIQSWDGIAATPLREWFHSCNNAISRGHAAVGIIGCKIAYEKIIKCVRKAAFGGHPLYVPRLPAGVTAEARRAIDTIREAAEHLDSQIVAIGIGLSLADHHRFVRCGLGVIVTEMLAGNYSICFVSPWNPNAEDKNMEEASFMLGYLAGAALTLETSYPGVFRSYQVRRPLEHEPFWPNEQGHGRE